MRRHNGFFRIRFVEVAKAINRLRVVEIGNTSFSVRISSSEIEKIGAIPFDEQLSVHVAGEMKCVPQSGGDECAPACHPIGMGGFQSERPKYPHVQDRRSMKVRIQVLQWNRSKTSDGAKEIAWNRRDKVST